MAFMDHPLVVDTITKEQLMAIKSGVLKHHKCVNDEVISDILFIIEYAFGFKNSYIPEDYMIDIIKDVFF